MLGIVTEREGREGVAMACCDVEDCFRPAERVAEDGRALCSAHRKQVQRKGRTAPIVERAASPRDRLFRAALELRDADSDDDTEYRRLERRFWEAFRAAAEDQFEQWVTTLMSPPRGRIGGR